MKKKTIYICSNCGYESAGYMGKCPECDSWNTLVETLLAKNTGNKASPRRLEKKNIIRLKEVKSENSNRIVTDLKEFNRVMGGGVVKDSVTIVSAKPGAGKSTLLLQVANELSSNDYKVLYASGEESESQIKSRADRIIKNIDSKLWVVSDNSMDNILHFIEEIDPDFIIIDSIQTFILDAFPGSRAGSPTQTMECAHALVKIAKDAQRPRAVFLVGQMTKDDEIGRAHV